MNLSPSRARSAAWAIMPRSAGKGRLSVSRCQDYVASAS